MSDLLSPMTFSRGPAMKNRFMLAPLTNCQSHEDGVLSEEEFHWLTMRAKGGFGLTMTCAAHVQVRGRGFLVSLAPGRTNTSKDCAVFQRKSSATIAWLSASFTMPACERPKG